MKAAVGTAKYINTKNKEIITTSEIKKIIRSEGLIRQNVVICGRVKFIQLLKQGSLKKIYEFEKVERK